MAEDEDAAEDAEMVTPVVGTTIRFTYSGGESPGTFRIAKVLEATDRGFKGIDITKEEWRQYNYDRMGTCSQVCGVGQDAIPVSQIFATTHGLPDRVIIDAFRARDKQITSCDYRPHFGVVVVTRTAKHKAVMTFGQAGVRFGIAAEDGAISYFPGRFPYHFALPTDKVIEMPIEDLEKCLKALAKPLGFRVEEEMPF